MRRDEPELFNQAQQLEDHMNARQKAAGRNPVYLTKFQTRLSDAITSAGDTLFNIMDNGEIDPNDEHGCDSGHCFT